ncbi:hypothetical protein ACJRPK_04900 [Aquimarina sp. 2-A2]|uniref:hypothetical protein n=1 Tax=Aquimarina sp. 2-A2 TaxID=3382644 RepID=UPI00387EF8CE
MKNTDIIIPEIDNKFEKFDIDKFDLEKENIFIKENDFYIKRMNQSFGFAKHLVKENSFFSILKLYFKNSFIKEKGISFNNGSEYGVWYKFDEQGNLIEEIDTDKGYDFDWKQVVHYCEKNKIELTKGYETSGFQTTIYKEESEEGHKTWVITYQFSGDQLIELTLDGITGKELNKKKLEFVNH